MNDEKPDAAGAPGAPDPTPPRRTPYRKTPPATPAVQAWLDGEQPREQLATADEQETAELWARINTEAEQLRKRKTPIQVQSKILSSLPESPPAANGEKPFSLSMPAAIIGGLAILAIGAIIGFLLV